MYQGSQGAPPRRGTGRGPPPEVQGVPPQIRGNPNPMQISGAARVVDMLDQLKADYETIIQQANIHKMERDEYERKLHGQLQEMEQIQQTLKALEANHIKIRQQYEDEIMMMRHQLETGGVRDGGVPPVKAAKRGRADEPQQQHQAQHRGGSRSLSPVMPPPAAKQSTPSQQVPQGSQQQPNPNSIAVVDKRRSVPSTNGSTERSTEREPPPVIKKAKVGRAAKEQEEKQQQQVPKGNTNNGPPPAAAPQQQLNTKEGENRCSFEEDDQQAPTSKVKWTIAYNTKAPSLPNAERPHVEMKHTLDHQSVVCCVRFSADGMMMTSGCHKTAQVFNVNSGLQVFSVSRPTTPSGQRSSDGGEDAYIRAVCFSPDGTKLVAGMPQNTIKTWDIVSKKEGLNFAGHDSEIYSLDYVNNFIASGSGDRKVRLWNAQDGSCHAVLGNDTQGPTDGVTSVALSPDGRLLAAASLDKVVRIWDTNTAQLVDRLEGHTDSVYSIAFSEDGKTVISGSLDKTLMLWDVAAGGCANQRPRLMFQGHKDFVLSVAYTPDNRWLISGSKDRSVIFWDPRTTRSILTLSGYRNSVISVASSSRTPMFATGSGDCFACIWKYDCKSG